MKDKRFYIGIILTIIIAIIILITCIWFAINKSNENKAKAMEIASNEEWFKNDLEKVFLTDEIDIIEAEMDGNKLTVKISVRVRNIVENFYKCRYILKNTNIVNWEWVYQTYIPLYSQN